MVVWRGSGCAGRKACPHPPPPLLADELWSACGSERIIVFTTNYLEKLDPALIRRGRMDKHIELSYCSFEAFKVLAKNYHQIDSHELFGDIEKALGETNMTPADVAESLMPKCSEDDADGCLKTLVEAISRAKEEARMKAEEEEAAREKQAEEEAKKKEEEDKVKPENEAKDQKPEAAKKDGETEKMVDGGNELKENNSVSSPPPPALPCCSSLG
uniref:ATPase AAA-type core domain-containing protein n=1 Tax=Kalanchoe fedtschenkoi TaxID=63787 RepID=A0A7N0ZUU3_KALFE